MTLLNTALCLPEIEVDLLTQGKSIVAAPQRFIVPGKQFALLPTHQLPGSLKKEEIYHPSILKKLHAFGSVNGGMTTIKAWAKCEFCQHLSDQEKTDALSQLTIWKTEALAQHLRKQENLFLAFLRVYLFSEPIQIQTFSSYETLEQVNKLTPLEKYLDVSDAQATLEDDQFQTFKKTLIELKIKSSSNSNFEDDSESKDEVKPKESELSQPHSILNTHDWFTRIAEIGNSSDGYTFEKLVRKALITLGFEGSSLSPDSTGGPGGMDFYCERPYPVVGECKATKSTKVKDEAPAQLLKIGKNHLGKDQYARSLKLIVAAGEMTKYAERTASSHEMNVIRPETFQSLLELKINYSESIDLYDLKLELERAPFGKESDIKISDYIERCRQDYTKRHQYIQQLKNIVKSVQELSAQPIHGDQPTFSTVEIRAHHNAKYEPCLTNDEIHKNLMELSSPLAGNLGQKKDYKDDVSFYFLKQLTISL